MRVTERETQNSKVSKHEEKKKKILNKYGLN